MCVVNVSVLLGTSAFDTISSITTIDTAIFDSHTKPYSVKVIRIECTSKMESVDKRSPRAIRTDQILAEISIWIIEFKPFCRRR